MLFTRPKIGEQINVAVCPGNPRVVVVHLRPRYDKTGLRTSYTFLLYLSDCAVGGGFGILADFLGLESWKLQDGCAKIWMVGVGWISYLPSSEVTYPHPRYIWRWFSFSKVGYVSFLEGNWLPIQKTNISHLGKRKIIFKTVLGKGHVALPWRVMIYVMKWERFEDWELGMMYFSNNESLLLLATWGSPIITLFLRHPEMSKAIDFCETGLLKLKLNSFYCNYNALYDATHFALFSRVFLLKDVRGERDIFTQEWRKEYPAGWHDHRSPLSLTRLKTL